MKTFQQAVLNAADASVIEAWKNYTVGTENGYEFHTDQYLFLCPAQELWSWPIIENDVKHMCTPVNVYDTYADGWDDSLSPQEVIEDVEPLAEMYILAEDVETYTVKDVTNSW